MSKTTLSQLKLVINGARQVAKLEKDKKTGKFNILATDTNILRKSGIYFVVNDCQAISFNIFGYSKKPRGFLDVVKRLNNPVSGQNNALSVQLAKISRRVKADNSIGVFYMPFSCLRSMIGLEHFNAVNDSVEMAGLLREHYNFAGRRQS